MDVGAAVICEGPGQERSNQEACAADRAAPPGLACIRAPAAERLRGAAVGRVA